MSFIYSPQYYADIGWHVFPIIKYREVYRVLKDKYKVPVRMFVAPVHASRSDLSSVHTLEYLDDLDRCAMTERTAFSELPMSKEIIDLFRLAAGGTILASTTALHRQWSIHLSGGFHHAFAARAEGFCYINDLAVAVRVLQNEGLMEKAAVIDCDLHQGNGTAAIFRGDDSVFTFSIHQRDLYPVKEESDLDIHLPNGTGDAAYMDHLEETIPGILADFAPDLVLYQAGADPFYDDQLGSLSLTIEGLKTRDAFVFEQCKSRGIPIAATLGGGYAYRTEDTVQIHVNTCLAAMTCFEVSVG